MSTQSKSEQRADRRKVAKRKDQMRNMLWIGGVALLVAVALIIPNIDFTPPVIVDYQMVDDNSIGAADAPVSVVEFGDYQCSHCRTFSREYEEDFIQNYVYTGEVLYTYRTAGDFFPGSARAGEANYCAGDQQAFWQYKDLLFEDITADFTDQNLIDKAQTLELDIDTFRECLDTNKYAERVAQDYTDFQTAGGSGTPSFLVNGVLAVAGADYEGLQAAIQAAQP